MTTRKQLIEMFKIAGYTGQSEPVAMKSWAEEFGFEIRDENDEVVDFDKAWEQKAVAKITTAKATPAAAQVDAAIERKAIGAPAIRTGDSLAYKSWIKNGKNPYTGERPVFDDVDTAEVAGAAIRLAFCNGVGINSYAEKARDIDIVGKAMATSPDSVGGALVPIEFQPMLIELKDQYGVARQLVGVTPSRAGNMTFPRLNADVTVYAAGEAAALTESSPTFNNVQAFCKKFSAYSYVSREVLLGSAISAVDVLARSHARALAEKEDQCFFNGDGTGTYNGIVGLKNTLGSAAKVQGAGNAWSAITDGDYNKLASNIMQNAYTGGTVQLACSQQAFFQVFDRLADAKGGVTYNESKNGAPIFRHRGTPAVIAQVLPTASAASTIFAYLGAFSRGCKFVEQTGGSSFEASEHVRFANDQIAYRSVELIDIVCHDVGDSSNLGQVAALHTSS